MAASGAMIDPAIFESLQAKIDDDTTFRDQIRDVVQLLEKQVKSAQAILSRIHSTSAANLPPLLATAGSSIKEEGNTVATLAQLASTQPYYKWNQMWNRTLQDTVCQEFEPLRFLEGSCLLTDSLDHDHPAIRLAWRGCR